jgi:hypothetical protein
MDEQRNPTTESFQDAIERVHARYPLAAEYASIEIQRGAMKQRGETLRRLWGEIPDIQDAIPEGFWEQDEDLWCFCAAGPAGHERGAGECHMRPPQRLLLCPNCRQPANVRISLVIGGEWDERWTEAATDCCGEWPLLANGLEATLDECE